jgi:hypothetical protein
VGATLYIDNRPLLARSTGTGVALATFGLDLAGRIVFACHGHSGGLESPYQLLQVIDESSRHPWECGHDEFLSSIKAKINAAPERLKTELLELYPDYQLPVLNGVTHLDIRDKRFEDDELVAVLGVLEMPGVEDALYEQFVEVLKGIGVEQAPHIPAFNPLYHDGEGCTPGQTVETTYYGWLRDGRVLIKSKAALPAVKNEELQNDVNTAAI